MDDADSRDAEVFMKLTTTSTCYLREIEMSDQQALQECFADEEVVRYVEFDAFTEESTRNFLGWAVSSAVQQPRTAYALAVCLAENEAVIGIGSLMVRDVGLREGDIGFMLGRAYWGRGLGSATAETLIAFGFEQLGLHRIVGRCAPANAASARVLEKVGMRREGHLRECILEKGAWRDRLVFAMLDHEYCGNKGGG